ncbi:MAG: helix-turn-helix domain-containing protein [Enterococcus sp.]|nr:helix-turn-helix domain-containing protein [Enterococcus sp.]
MDDYFLNREQKATLNILNYVLSSQKQAHSNKEIMDHLHLSGTYLNKLYESLHALSQTYPEFEFQASSKGCLVHFHEEFSLSKIHNSFLKSSIEYKLLEELFYDRFDNLTAFSHRVNFSVRTVQRAIEKLKKLLSHYNLSLNFFKQRPLEGQEFILRFFFERLQWELFDETLFIQSMTRSSVNTRLFDRLKQHLPWLNEIDYLHVINIIEISTLRIRKGHFIQDLPPSIYEISNPQITFDTFKKTIIRPHFIQFQQTTVDFEKEAVYLYSLLSLAVDTTGNTDEPSVITSNKQYIEISDFFLHLVQKSLSKQVSRTDRNDIQHHFLSLFIRFTLFRTNTTISPALLEKQDPNNESIHTLLSWVLDRCAANYSKYKTIFLDPLFTYRVLSFFKCIIKKYLPTIKILLLSKNGPIEVLNWKEELKQLNGGKIEYKTQNRDIDLILSDFPIDKLIHRKNSPVAKFLIWDPALQEKNVNNVDRLIQKIQKEKLEELFQSI